MIFWLIAILLGLIASAFVLAPILFGDSRTYNDQRIKMNLSLYHERIVELNLAGNTDEAHALELDAKKALLSDTAPSEEGISRGSNERAYSLAAALLVPIAAFYIYSDFGLGRGAMPDVELAKAMLESDVADPASYRYFIQQVEDRVEERPDDPDTRFLLARGYASLGAYAKSVPEYKKLLEYFPGDPNLSSQYAETLYMADGKKVTPRVLEAVGRALKTNPHDTTMLELRGIASAEEGDNASALLWLSKALQTGVTGQRAEMIESAMTRLKGQGGEIEPFAPEEEPLKKTERTGRVISVRVSSASSIGLPVDSAVFVYAKAVSGPPAPLAVKRVRLGQLPMTIILDESMGMVAGMGLANFDKVIVVARVSASGQVTPSAGDYEARSGELDLNSEVSSIDLNISKRI